MPNPVFNQAIDAVSNFIGLSGDRRDIIYDEYLDSASPRMNKALEERGFIEFRYGGNQFAVDSQDLFSFQKPLETRIRPISQSKKLPFFEDPTFKETGASNYAENKVLMRNEPVRLYVGTEARTINVEMTYTLPHVMAMLRSYSTDDVKDDIEATRQRMVDIISEDFGISETQRNINIRTVDDTPVGIVVNDNTKKEGPRLPANRSFNLGQSVLENYLYTVASNPQSYGQSDLYAYIGHLMNIIKSSIRSSLGAGQNANARYGAPIALLKFGAVYDYLPCIVKDYRVEYRFDSGNDNASLYPRIIRVKIKLEEFRQSNGILHGEGNDVPWGWDTIFREGMEPPSSSK